MENIKLNKLFTLFYFTIFITTLLFIAFWQYQFLIKSYNTHIKDKTQGLDTVFIITLKEEFHRIESVLKATHDKFLNNNKIKDIDGIDLLYFIKNENIIKLKSFNINYTKNDFESIFKTFKYKDGINIYNINNINMFLLYSTIDVIDENTGKFLGKYIGVKILNNNTKLINNLQNKLNIKDIKLKYKKLIIASSFKNKDQVTDKNIIEIESYIDIENIKFKLCYFIDNSRFEKDLNSLYLNMIYLSLFYILIGLFFHNFFNKRLVKKLELLNEFIQTRMIHKTSQKYHNSEIYELDQIYKNFLNLFEEIEKKQKNILRTKNILSQAQHIAKLGSWSLDIQKNHLEWSDVIFEIFEIDKKQFEPSYEYFLSLIHPQDKNKVDIAFQNSLKNKIPYEIEHRILLKNGTIKYVKENGYSTYIGNKAVFSSGTVQDITKDKLLGTKIANEKNFISTIIESSNAVIAVIDSKGVMKRLNRYGQEFTGYDIEQVSSEPFFWARFLPLDKKREVLGIIDKANQGKIVKSFKNSWISKNGEERIFEWSNTLVQKDDGTMDYIATIGIDITVKDKLEKDIIYQKELFRNIFEQAAVGIAHVSPQGDWIKVNQKVCDIVGYTKDELIKLTFQDITHKEDLEKDLEYVYAMLDKKIDTYSMEKRYIKKDGSLIWVNLTVSLVFKNNGEADYFISVIEDINDKKKQEHLILKQKEQLEIEKERSDKANKAKSDFLANMSHEIRTPLNGVIGLTDLILQTDLNPTQKEYLLKSKRSSKALLHVINDILDYSKIEAGKLDIVNQEFNFKSLFESLDDLFGYEALAKSLNLNFEIDNSMPKILFGDPLRLTQILNNLVGNALKFTDNGSVLIKLSKIDMYKANKTVKFQVSVEDTGIGISKENQIKLFKPFEQLDNSNSKKYGGTGLGLMITKQLLELMGGKLEVSSELGIGTKFYFEITMEYIEKEKIEFCSDNKKTKTIKLTNTKSALIAEDNEVNQIISSKVLQNIGFKVSIANDGLEAVQKAKENSYDIIFMDLQMPNMDGFEASKAIRRFNDNIPIVALSAAVMQEDKELTKKSGMNDHLAKPMEKEQLNRVIKNYFECSYLDDTSKSKSLSPLNNIDIKGIDLDRLFNNIVNNNPQNIYSMYDSFKNSFKDFLQKVDTFNIDSQEFKKYIHSLKGVSGSLFISNVFNICKDLETTDNKKEKLSQLKDEMKFILQEIEDKISSKIVLEEKTLNTKELINEISKMTKLFENSSFISRTSFNQFVSNLGTSINFKQKTKLKEYFDQKDFIKLIEILKQIKVGTNEKYR